ncbi:unnamed protein product [Cyclocybe aegerita]|uniref:DUF659 domain-containing protein n=1 Tax=Cyclocybe aegerita TaxID=1973307 RepID=A0A8S0VYM4_CYCAE|nr:unnamed protein product [Cyclocybe aegerita]
MGLKFWRFLRAILFRQLSDWIPARPHVHDLEIRIAGSSQHVKKGKQKASVIQSAQVVKPVPWTPEEKREWEEMLVQLTASADFSLSWVKNPVWEAIRDKFIPQAPVVMWKVLTNRLHHLANDIRTKVKTKVEGKEVTLQGDGWTGLNNHHLIAFMVTCDKEVHTVKVHDALGERKTAEVLLDELERVLSTLQNEWGAVVVGLVTDASGESRKAQRLFACKYPHIIVLNCYAHQINLIVGDFFKSQSGLLEYMEMATKLIKGLRSKTCILHYLPYVVL